MKGWESVAINELCDVIVDCVNRTAPTVDYKTPYKMIRTTNVRHGRLLLDDVNYVDEPTYTKWTRRCIPQKFDVILTREAPLGEVGIITTNDKLFLGQRTVMYRANKSVCNPRFLFYSLVSPHCQNQIRALGSGSTVEHMRVPDSKKIEVLLPRLATQQKIVSILSAYDDLIENNLKRIKLLEEIAQRTYEEWFVKFKVKGEELAINEETGLPEGWVLKKIGDSCQVSGGGTPSRAIAEYWDGGKIEWYSPTDLSRSKSFYQGGSADKITELGLSKSSAKLLQSNSFMMTSRATIGLFGRVDKPFCTNQGFINVTPFEAEHKEYLFYNFLTRVDEFKGYATGATFPELSKSKFKALDIIWPSVTVIADFHQQAIALHKAVATLSKQNSFLKEARDILLPKLMSGEIDVEEMVLAGVATK